MDSYRVYCRQEVLNSVSAGKVATASPDSIHELGYGSSTGTVEKELRSLFSNYPGGIAFGVRNKAPCSVWRSERLLIGDETLPRFANRLFVFQKCPHHRYGAFLGYVSLRPRVSKVENIPYPFTAVAHIVPPRHLLRPRYHVLTTVSGPPDGILPFRASPFCLPNADTENRASCLHSALQSALMLKMNAFRCTPISSQDMLALLWTNSQRRRSLARLSKEGATLTEALNLLRLPEVGSGGILETIREKDFPADVGHRPSGWSRKVEATLEAHHCLTDYLANGLPVIMELPVRDEFGDARRRDDGRLLHHSMLLIGMHLLHDPEDPHHLGVSSGAGSYRVDVAELPGRFIVHDIRWPPFTEIGSAELLTQAWIEQDNQGRQVRDPGYHFLAIAPAGTKMGIGAARRLARLHLQAEQGAFRQHFLAALPTPTDESGQSAQPRLVTRLIATEEIARRYKLPSTEARVFDKMNRGSPFHFKCYWWAVEARAPRVMANLPARECPAIVYFWKASDDPQKSNCPVRAILRIQGKGKSDLNFGSAS